ncbi:MAG TPA: hypothetical protein VF857_10090 [Spirochaetota bacterium]
MRQKFLFLVAVILSTASLHAADTRILVLPFSSDRPDEISAFTTSLMSKAPAQTVLINPSEKQPEIPSDGITAESYIAGLGNVAQSNHAEYALTGSVRHNGSGTEIISILVRSKEQKIFYQTKIQIFPSDKKYDPIPELWGRMNLALEGKSYPITNLKIQKGDSPNQIGVEWDQIPECKEYLVYRSRKADGAFEQVAKTNRPALYDKTPESGARYYYYVQPVVNGVRLDPSAILDGYKKPAIPKSEDLRTMLKSFAKPVPHLTTDEEKKVEEQIAKIRPYYQNRTKLNLTLHFVNDYVVRKELFVYRNFPNPVVDTQNRTMTMTANGNSYIVLFNNNSFFSKIVSLNDEELTNRLVRNAVFFCVPTGEKEIVDENGESKFIPIFEAIGMCTQYYKEARNWEDTTIIFGTSNKELKAKIEEARRKLEGPRY